jgi:AAA domain
MNDDAFNKWVEDAVASDILAVAQSLPELSLKKSGKDWHGPCPQCGGDTSFIITAGNSPSKQFFCRKLGKGGGVVAMVAHAMGVQAKGKAFVQICERILNEPPPGMGSTYKVPSRSIQKEDKEEKLDREISFQIAENESRATKIEKAQSFWSKCLPIEGTHGHNYLKRRKADLPKDMLSSLRFLPSCEYWGKINHDDEVLSFLGFYPCVVMAFQDVNGNITGIHRTYLDKHESMKLVPPGDKSNKAKKMDGVCMGSLIYLGPCRESMAIAEGLETGASWYGMGLATEAGLAIAGSIGNMCGGATDTLPHPVNPKTSISNGDPDFNKLAMKLPITVESVILLKDSDSDPHWTDARILTGARRLRSEERQVSIHSPPLEADWNTFVVKEMSSLPPILSLVEFEAHCDVFLRPPREERFGRISWHELDKPGRELEYIIDDWMTVGGKSVMAGASGSGKSFLAIEAGLSIALGKRWFGHDVMQGLVIYQAGEGGLDVLNRLKAYRKHFQVPHEGLVPFELLTEKIDIFAPDDAGGDVGKFIESINGIKRDWPGQVPRVLFIDTFAVAQGAAEEISNKDIMQCLANCDRIEKSTGFHVCLVHHMNAEGKRVRGGTSLGANVDQIYIISRDEQTNVRTITLKKIKSGEDGLRFDFELLSVELGMKSNGKPRNSCVCLPSGQKSAIYREEAERGIALNPQEINLMRAFFDAMRKHGAAPKSDLPVPNRVKEVVDWQKVLVSYAEMNPIDHDMTGMAEDAVQAIRAAHRADHVKRVKRSREYLSSRNIIGVYSPFAWYSGKPLRAFPHTLPLMQTVVDSVSKDLEGVKF